MVDHIRTHPYGHDDDDDDSVTVGGFLTCPAAAAAAAAFVSQKGVADQSLIDSSGSGPSVGGPGFSAPPLLDGDDSEDAVAPR